MKFCAKQLLTVILITAMLITAFSACTNSDDIIEPPDYVLMPSLISFAEISRTVGDIANIIFSDGVMYFSAIRHKYEGSLFYETIIYSVNFDGSSLTDLSELQYYILNEPPEGATGGGVNITAMHIDIDGNLWVVEQEDFLEGFKPQSILRKLDTGGAELLSVDISSLTQGLNQNIDKIVTDNDGYIYISTLFAIFVLKNNGELLHRIEGFGLVREMLKLYDGSVAVVTMQMLQVIDIEEGTLGENITLPHDFQTVFPGGNDYIYMFSDGIGLYGVDIETGFEIWLMDWMESDISPHSVAYMTFLLDGRIVFTTETFGNLEIVVLALTQLISPGDITSLTLAAIAPIGPALRDFITQFNRTSTTHRIEFIDYYPYDVPGRWNDVFHIALDRLTLDITTGKVPDILYLTNLPFQQWATRGLFIDLYPFIDSDAKLSRSDLVESAFHAHEIDGSLYSIFDSFAIYTLAGLTSVVGDESGWTMDELNELLEANPQVDLPFGEWQSKEGFLRFFITLSKGEYIDYSAGTVHFDNGGFAGLLAQANALSAVNRERGWHIAEDWSDWGNRSERIASGRQLVGVACLEHFRDALWLREAFQGDFTFIGIPSENRTVSTLVLEAAYLREGNMYHTLNLAITAACEDKQGAWEFIRGILTEDYQLRYRGIDGSSQYLMFPSNRAALETELTWAMARQPPYRLQSRDADKVMYAIENVSGMTIISDALWSIISESAVDYWNRQISLEDAVRIVQNRASRYVAEQAG